MIEHEILVVAAGAFRDVRVREAEEMGLPLTERMRGLLGMDAVAAHAVLSALIDAGYMVVPIPGDT